MSENELLKMAMDARSRAYAKYSGFAVGAALLTSSGKVFQGCNVENISLGLTMCAERVAIGAAVADGNTKFVSIAIMADSTVPIMPCGACRQVLAEFSPDLRIVTSTMSGQRETVQLDELLPHPAQGILDPPKNV